MIPVDWAVILIVLVVPLAPPEVTKSASVPTVLGNRVASEVKVSVELVAEPRVDWMTSSVPLPTVRVPKRLAAGDRALPVPS